ncbi:protein LSD1-like isoform X4 [Salvia miltiorrhiza]|nr:protein LSD1-like isoform X4 [Salvia miltiorrhiza]XP_057812194.1 protein LSD1-like isoform X4 [Salvia miltiorrhiza]
MRSKIFCAGCRTVLLYPRGATNVCCAICNMITPAPPGASAAPPPAPPPAPSNVAHVNCGNCHTMLMYPAGAPSVKCAICHFITNVNNGNTRVPIPVHRPGGITTSASPPTYLAPSQSHSQTVVVHNPRSSTSGTPWRRRLAQSWRFATSCCRISTR